MRTMIIATATLLALSVGSTAYAGEGEGATATELAWRAANGNAPVPASEWYTADATQRAALSNQFAGTAYRANDNEG